MTHLKNILPRIAVYTHIMCVVYILYKVQTIVLLLPSKL